MILSVTGLSKNYAQGDRQIHALQDFNLRMERGETLAVVGPSGSGKTTLLSLLAGLDEPSSGRIQLQGRDLTDMDERSLSEFRGKNMGIVFQQFHLIPYLTAAENVSLPLEIAGEKQAEEKALAALKSVGLEARALHRPDQLSGGECQRVAIARALVTEPQILLADEPSGNLDAATGEKVMDLLFDLVHARKMTLVLVTHNMEHAKRCRKIVELKGGRLSGPPA